jgi:hypothetical protein
LAACAGIHNSAAFRVGYCEAQASGECANSYFPYGLVAEALSGILSEHEPSQKKVGGFMPEFRTLKRKRTGEDARPSKTNLRTPKRKAKG